MKFFVCFALIAAVAINGVLATPTNAGAVSAAAGSVNAEEADVVQYAQPSDLTRLRKSAYGGGSSGGGYGGASMPSPPCPKNYLFSCQPNLAPVPCSSPSSYGSAGAYSNPVATYVSPNYGAPQHQPIYTQNFAAYVPQTYAYQY